LNNTLFGKVIGTDEYKSSVRLDDLEGSCSCPVGYNCKHCVAVLLQYLSGDYIDGDKIIKKLENADKSEILNIFRRIIEADTMLLSLLQFSEVSIDKNLAEKEIKRMLNQMKVNGYVDENFAYNFAKIIKFYEDVISKELIFSILEFLVKNYEDYGGFYDDYSDRYFGDVIFRNLCDAFIKKAITPEDFKKLQELLKYDDHGILYTFIYEMCKPENAQRLAMFSKDIKKLLNDLDYVEFLININKLDEAKNILETKVFKEDFDEWRVFNLYLKIDENEAMKFAKNKGYYLSLIKYFYEHNRYKDVIETFRTMINTHFNFNALDFTGEIVFNSIMKDKPDDSEILLHKLFNICYNSRDYDSCIDIGISLNDTESLKNMLKKDIFNHITHQSKTKLLKYFSKLDNENAKNYLTEFIEKLIEEQDNNSYDIATEGFIVLKNIMKNEEWKEYLEKIHKKHYRKINLWKKAKLKGIIN
jgi:uncharacterized Zn finger protein